MIHLFKFYRANTALACTDILIGYLAINTKDQLEFIVTARDLLRLAGHNLESKTDYFSNYRNWGFPKGGNSYHWAGTNERYRLYRGNGVSVV